MSKNTIVFYHAECRDGFGSAWSAWKKFGNKAEYIPAIFMVDPPFDKIRGKEIYMIDFCYNEGIMDKIIKLSKRLVVIDHHESKKDFVKSLKGSVYGDKNSGAVLAWKYFHPNKKIPLLLKYVEGNDLWNFSLPLTKEAGLFIDSQNTDFKTWDKLAKDFDDGKKRRLFLDKGKLLVDFEAKIRREILGGSYEVIFDGQKVWVVNSPRKFRSETATELAKKGSGLGISWHRNKNLIEFSLRSDGRVDTTKSAKKYGGGGHPNASGFKIKANQKFPWKEIK